MATIHHSPDCNPWQNGMATMHPPADAEFLSEIFQAGFLSFIGPGGLCGGKTENRSVIAIHRGRGTKWELVFRENETDVVTTTTTDLLAATQPAIAWLSGQPLSATENSVHAVAV